MSQSPVSPNDFDPFSSNKARTLVGLCAAFSCLAAASVTARFYSRAVKRVKPELSDWLVVGSLFFYFTFVVQEIICVRIGGLGHHIQDIPPEYALNLAKLSIFCQLSYVLAMSLARWSICSLLRRIFWTAQFRRIALGITVFNALWTLWGILSIVLRCLPPSDSWNDPFGSNCLSEMPILATTATWGLVIEIMIWSAPIPMVWNLNTPRSNKIALTAIFAFGFLDIVIGIIRLVTVIIIDFSDASYSEAFAVYWIVIEPSISIMVVSLPLCRPLFNKIFPRRIVEFVRPRITPAKIQEKFAAAAPADHINPLNLYRTAALSSDRNVHADSQNWRPHTPESSDSPHDGDTPESISPCKIDSRVMHSTAHDRYAEV